MTTLRIQSLSCPHCQNKMYTVGLMSYIVKNTEVYSDGKIVCNPPRPIDNKILICSACYQAFWKGDAIIDSEKNEEDLDKLPVANNLSDLFPNFEFDHKNKLANYYSNLINNGFANTKEREIYLRKELWISLNDQVRYKQNPKTENKGLLFKNNLQKLIELIEPETYEEQLLMVEMYRELGAFKKAKYLLESLKKIKNSATFLQIEKAIKTNDAAVIKLEPTQS